MAYSLNDLEIEIIQKIEREKDNGNERIHADWVAHAVMADHPRIEGEDKEFYTVCSYRTVRETTRKVMGKYRKNEIPEEFQMTMEGFEHLQVYYVVTQIDSDGDKTQVQVHISAMTYDELTAKAKEHEAFAKSHLSHSREIYRFRDEKFFSEAVA